ncbi:MAG: hypothetical protein J6T16_07450 [Opitutales bacterium]|nr:hypothetical protein [Opitutales bacterium]
MISPADKIRSLNRILASRGVCAEGKFGEVSKAVEFALKSGQALNIGEFAKTVMRMYDAGADLEFVDIKDDYFDPIFAMEEISAAAKRLSGCAKPILVVAGMDKSALRGGKNWSQKKREEYFENLSVVESFVLRYESSISNIEIIFI